MSESYVRRCVACPSTTSTMHANRALSQNGTRRLTRGTRVLPVAGGSMWFGHDGVATLSWGHPDAERAVSRSTGSPRADELDGLPTR